MPAPKPILKPGDQVRLNSRYPGHVVMASENGCSVLVALEDGLPLRSGVFLNFAALSIDYDQETVTELFTGSAIEIEVADAFT